MHLEATTVASRFGYSRKVDRSLATARFGLGALLLTPPATGPLIALRVVVGLWAGWLAFRLWLFLLAGGGWLYDTGLIAEEAPSVAASLLRHPLIAGVPELVVAAGALASVALAWGVRPRLSAAALWLLAHSFQQLLFPLYDAALEALCAVLALTVLLPLPARTGGRRRLGLRLGVLLYVVVLAHLLFARASSACAPVAAELACLVVVAALAVAALVMPSGARSGAVELDVGVVLLMLAVLLMPVRTGIERVAPRVLDNNARVLASFAQDLGLSARGPRRVGATGYWQVPTAVVHMRDERGGGQLDQAALWSDTRTLRHAWAYLASLDMQRSVEQDPKGARLPAALRQSLADTACTRGRPEAPIDVFAREGAERPVLSFYCVADRAQLMSRVRRGSAAADRAPQGEPLATRLRAAYQHFQAREFDAAIRLVESAVHDASPRQRERANLDALLVQVRQRGKAW